MVSYLQFHAWYLAILLISEITFFKKVIVWYSLILSTHNVNESKKKKEFMSYIISTNNKPYNGVKILRIIYKYLKPYNYAN